MINNNKKIIDVKYSIAVKDGYNFYSAMIIYEEN